jgi:hypothetical protein
VAATAVEHPSSVESAEMLQAKNPLVYYFGHTSPSGSQTLYERLVEKLSGWVAKRCATLDSGITLLSFTNLNDSSICSSISNRVCPFLDG